MDSYQELISQIVLPTHEQTMRFVDYVVRAHSWYKHLPLFPPGATFVFYFDPDAGRILQSQEGKRLIKDIEDKKECSHYNMMLTSEYREKFGCWNFWVDYNPRYPYVDKGPWLYIPNDTEPVLLPDYVKQKNSCRLTAFLRQYPLPFFSNETLLLQDIELFELFSKEHPEDTDIERYRPIVEILLLTEGKFSGYGPTVIPFMDREAEIQRNIIESTLKRVRSLHNTETDNSEDTKGTK
jgi:hypothetical protein